MAEIPVSCLKDSLDLYGVPTGNENPARVQEEHLSQGSKAFPIAEVRPAAAARVPLSLLLAQQQCQTLDAQIAQAVADAAAASSVFCKVRK